MRLRDASRTADNGFDARIDEQGLFAGGSKLSGDKGAAQTFLSDLAAFRYKRIIRNNLTA